MWNEMKGREGRQGGAYGEQKVGEINRTSVGRGGEGEGDNGAQGRIK